MDWNEKYSVGIAEIDEQHKTLMNCISDVDGAIQAGDGWSEVHSTLLTLSKYVDIHFAVEESLMRIHDFPEIEAHIDDHVAFRDRLKTFQIKVLREDISAEMVTFLKSWWHGHILTKDKIYAWYMPKVGVKGTWWAIFKRWFLLRRRVTRAGA